jgi:hypothetical protein
MRRSRGTFLPRLAWPWPRRRSHRPRVTGSPLRLARLSCHLWTPGAPSRRNPAIHDIVSYVVEEVVTYLNVVLLHEGNDRMA